VLLKKQIKERFEATMTSANPSLIKSCQLGAVGTMAAVGLMLIPLSSAYALEVGNHGTPKAVNSHLQKEGHSIVAAMNTLVTDTIRDRSPEFMAQMITRSADGEEWYMIVADTPIGEKASKMAIKIKGDSIRFHDYRNNASRDFIIPDFVKGKDEDKYLHDMNRIADKYEANLEERLVMQALGTWLLPSGQKIEGVITLFADPEKDSGNHVLNNKDFTMLLSAGDDIKNSSNMKDSGPWDIEVINIGHNFFLNKPVTDQF